MSGLAWRPAWGGMSRGARIAAGGVCALLAGVAVWRLIHHARELDPAPPTFVADSIEPPHPPVSTISVPFAFPVSVLSTLLENEIPTSWGTLDSLQPLPRRGRTSVAVALARGPFRVAVNGEEARIQTTIGYALRVSYGLPALPDVGGSCGIGEARPRLAVTLESPLSLDSAWSLRTAARVVGIRPASPGNRDRCQVTFLGLDVTADVVAASRRFLEAHLDDLDRRAAEADTRKKFEEWWGRLREPIQLDDSLWLAIGPETIRRGPLRGSGDTVRVELSLGARPRIVYGPRPQDPLSPLPPLDTGTVEPRLDLLVDARVDYPAISDLLDERLGGTEVELGDRSLRIESLRIFGIGGGRLALELRVAGDLSGRLYLTGTPTIERLTGKISIPDLEFDVATRRALFPFLSELLALPLRDFLRERAVWPAEPAVEWLTGWLDVGLNRNLSEDLAVSGTVHGVRIVGAYAMRDALYVRLSAAGRASLVLLD